MENQKRRKVTRQNWKPGAVWTGLHTVWVAIYSVVKVVLAALATVLAIAAICAVVFVGVLADYLEGDIVPQAGVQLEGFDLNQPSYLYYIDDAGNIQVLQKLYAAVNSEWADYEEIPESMIEAAVSIEDHRFFEHQGVDWFTTIKACIGMFIGDVDGGGSSITQQLIKNLLLTEDETANDITVQRKVLEIFRATEFEKRYDKTVVLEWYLNYIFLGNNCTGVKAAASRYFGKEVEDLTPCESACIISITNNPTIFNPLSDQVITYNGSTKTAAEWNKWRRENVLWMMHEYGYLTDEEYAQAEEQSENLEFKSGLAFEDTYSDCEECGYHGHNDQFVPVDGVYYCPQCEAATTIGENASREVYSWFVETVVDDLAADMITEAGLTKNDDTMNLYRTLIANSGYHIYTTFDMAAQTAVDNIYTNLDEIPKTYSMQQLQSGIVLIDNRTGDVVAISGGVGEKTTYFAYNRANVDQLQTGSSIKPLTVYAPAFELGLITPATVIKDMPLKYFGDEEDEEKDELISYPKNDHRYYTYSYNIFWGMTSSINTIAANTLNIMGLETAFYFARDKFRLSGLVDSYTNASGSIFTDIDFSPLALGAQTLGVSVRDMSAAFATFANNGVWREARTYTHVYNSDGTLVMFNEQESERILSEKTVNYVNYCLTNAVNWGTGPAAKVDGQEVAGKTGTSSGDKERWFCGYTAYYTAAIWSGYDMPETISTVEGRINPACRLFKKVMTPLHAGLKSVKLYDNSDWVNVGTCLDCGGVAVDGCSKDVRGSRVTYAQVAPEDVPTELCSCHVAVDYCSVCEAPANEYCLKFAEEGKTTISSVYLCKVTQEHLQEILKACKYGLLSYFKDNKYIYLVDKDGNDVPFHGVDEDLQLDLDYPYIVGTKHTKRTWQQYVASKGDPVTPPEEDPDKNDR